MNKVTLSLCALTMSSLVFASCEKSNNEVVKKVEQTVSEFTQKVINSYKEIGTLASLAKKADAKDGSTFVNAVEKVSPYLAVGNPLQKEIQQEWKTWASNYETFAKRDASNGTGGILMRGKNKLVVNGNAVEVGQLFKKGFIGAYTFSNAQKAIEEISNDMSMEKAKMCLDKAVTYYLGDAKFLDEYMKALPKDAMPPTVTTTATTSLPQVPYAEGNEFGKYVNQVAKMPAGANIDAKFMGNLMAAKMAKTPELMKSYLNKAQAIANKIIMIRCCYYIKEGLKKYSQANVEFTQRLQEAFHPLSEALGFFYCTQFMKDTNGKTVKDRKEVNSTLQQINLWNDGQAAENLLNVQTELAKMFEIDVNKL